ncbi:prefoldin subunit [Candidatus Micrarchaeota archaeon]|nr:prefoldin subunit [Candidatus Micrarchaeota archaeon]
MTELNEEMKKELVEYQNMQQQLQLILLQKQQIQIQLNETERAEEELKKSEGKFYRFAGSVLIPKEKEVLKKELKEEKESLELRKSVIQKQEEKITERMNSVRKKFEEYGRGPGGNKSVGDEASAA